jgi:uncharacterized protein YjlB
VQAALCVVGLGRPTGSPETAPNEDDVMSIMNAIRSAEVEIHRFEDDGSIPNNPQLPLLLYRGALDFGHHDPALVCEQVFANHGWGDAWRNGIYPFPHYHSTAHEVLGIARGHASVRLGGARGRTVTVQAGDVVVIPAGVGHQNLGASADLLVIGAYPHGQSADLGRGAPGERPRVLDAIARVPLPQADPVYGEAGPLPGHWRTRA